MKQFYRDLRSPKNKFFGASILAIILLINAVHAFIATGTNTVSSAQGLDAIGFLFSNGTITGNNGDFYYYERALWTNGAGGIKDMGSVNVNACDTEGYAKSNIPAIEGEYYCIKTNEGSYAKIIIIGITSDSMTFTWSHQRDGTNTFIDEEQEVVQEINYNNILIGIIISLIAIVLIIWKYR